MATSDVFLKLAGVTGEALDSTHKGEIEVVSLSWSIEAPSTLSGSATGKARMTEVVVTKRVDVSSPTLLNLCNYHRNVKSGVIRSGRPARFR